jgi:cytochrome c-type biogenesis protein CcmH
MSIENSPAETARNMKRQVRAMVAVGYDDEQIEAYFVSVYGEFVLMSPRFEGLNLLVWGAPVALVVGGLGLVFGVVRRKGVAPTASPPASETTDDPYLKRIREEVDGV